MVTAEVTFSSRLLIFQASGNRVSRQSVLCGSQNIVLNGKNIVQSEAIIRGDLANVRVVSVSKCDKTMIICAF